MFHKFHSTLVEEIRATLAPHQLAALREWLPHSHPHVPEIPKESGTNHSPLPNRFACHSNVVAYATFFLASTFATAQPGSTYASPAFPSTGIPCTCEYSDTKFSTSPDLF